MLLGPCWNRPSGVLFPFSCATQCSLLSVGEQRSDERSDSRVPTRRRVSQDSGADLIFGISCRFGGILVVSRRRLMWSLLLVKGGPAQGRTHMCIRSGSLIGNCGCSRYRDAFESHFHDSPPRGHVEIRLDGKMWNSPDDRR